MSDLEGELNEETVKLLISSATSLKAVLDRCVVSGKIFNTIEEASASLNHLVRLSKLIDQIRDGKLVRPATKESK
jgi:hypothetical protein